MGLVNRKLEEKEIREYVLEYPRKGKKVKFVGGTIDAENDIRLFYYANGPIGKMEPSDIYSFVFDYKGKVFFIDLREELLTKNDVHWFFEFAREKNKLNDEQLQYLREAMKVYAYEGFNIREWNILMQDPSYITRNDKSNVFIEF